MAFSNTLTCFILLYTTVTTVVSFTTPVRNVTDCSCGYYDHLNHNWFTESAIVYFNETTLLPADVFTVQQYEHQREKGWNTQYRQGADISNVCLGEDLVDHASNKSLQLYVDPSTPDHLVVGGGVRTVRQDIHYGSFRTLLRSPQALGSSLSMVLDWNDTQQITMNLQSTDDKTNAWVSMLNSDEFPTRSLGVNYSILSNDTKPWNNNIAPWNYTEYRVDWTPKQVNWTIGGKLFRQLNKTSEKFPQTPVPLILEHYSVGNWYSMQGPPTHRSVANVGWVRLFFNSSLATEESRRDFAQRCRVTDACAMENTNLRGASPYPLAATRRWKQIEPPRGDKVVATTILIICGGISFFLVCNALGRRIPRLKFRRTQPAPEDKQEKVHTSPYTPSAELLPSGTGNTHNAPQSRAISYCSQPASPASSTPQLLPEHSSVEHINIHMDAVAQDEDAPNEKRKSARLSWREFNAGYRDAEPYKPTSSPQSAPKIVTGDHIVEQPGHTPQPTHALFLSRLAKGKSVKSVRSSVTNLPVLPAPERLVDTGLTDKMLGYGREPASVSHTGVDTHDYPIAFKSRDLAEALVAGPTLPANQHQVDHLAGLVAFSALLVTAIHFCLTFAPAAINPGDFAHYDSEVWARKTIGSYFLNLIWIGRSSPTAAADHVPCEKLIRDWKPGPFLMTSARFLVSRYLQTGELLGIAEKVVARPFRLLIPILAVAMLEYFFMDSGATASLEYLASVTWCTWPFTTVPNNFGNFISEFLELAYLIPNAVPQITFNYCTGVLWTIPIQLQGSWVTLLACIVIREIKKPWKRFGFYTFCILMQWYALSWGTYFYLGILLTDLDLTYKYRKWLYAHPFVYYPFIILCVLMAFGALSMDMATQWTNVQYAAFEYGMHPDIPTGLPIMWTGAAGYPQYYIPTAHGIIFAFGIQALVELSPLVQKIFSLNVFVYVFPHIYTIYLIHGFIFWSLGSLICVYLAGQGVAYWANLLIVAVCCYAVLIASCPLLTPVVETLGKHVTHNIWQFAHENPAPRRPTLYPFPDNFLFMRQFEQDVDADARPVEIIHTSKLRGPLRRFMASVAAVARPHLSEKPQEQSDNKISISPASRSASVAPRSIASRNVGWRAGPLSDSVEELRLNNSSGTKDQ